jgi:hypothetical protein
MRSMITTTAAPNVSKICSHRASVYCMLLCAYELSYFVLLEGYEPKAAWLVGVPVPHYHLRAQ